MVRALSGIRETPVATRVLLIEDDDGDAFLVEELLHETGKVFDLHRVRTLAEAKAAVQDAACVLLDLGQIERAHV